MAKDRVARIVENRQAIVQAGIFLEPVLIIGRAITAVGILDAGDHALVRVGGVAYLALLGKNAAVGVEDDLKGVGVV